MRGSLTDEKMAKVAIALEREMEAADLWVVTSVVHIEPSSQQAVFHAHFG